MKQRKKKEKGKEGKEKKKRNRWKVRTKRRIKKGR